MSASTQWHGTERLVLVLHRDCANRHHFDSSEQTFALKLLPHLHQSVQNQLRFEAAQNHARALESAFDQLRCAVALSTPEGSIRWANRAAQQIFARRDRLWLQEAQLKAPCAQETTTLRRLIAQVAAEQPGEIAERFAVLGGRAHGSPLQIMLQPVLADGGRRLDGRNGRLVLLILSEPCAPPELPAEALVELFGLSNTEARLAAALCRGATLSEYASVRGVTIGTARFQLKQVLAKTRSPRQGSLIQQLCSSVIAQCVSQQH
ncbi:MAG: hypothetical protein ABI885_25255 [Gammaproteobacteria bacterium]